MKKDRIVVGSRMFYIKCGNCGKSWAWLRQCNPSSTQKGCGKSFSSQLIKTRDKLNDIGNILRGRNRIK